MTAAVRVLGTVAVTREGTELPLSPQRRLLLALLVARFPHPVSSDRLIDDLWDGSPPPSAATALRVHITHLRRAIAGCDGTIDYRAGQF